MPGRLSRFALALSGLSIAGAPLALPLQAQTFRTTGAPTRPVIAFGSAIAISGEDVFVGRPEAVGGFPMPPAATGAVHVFRRDGQTWRETAAITVSDAVIGDMFGGALAAGGNVLAVGAPNAREGRGAVYIFERDRGAWVQRARLGTDGAANDMLGAALAVGDGVVLAGAPGAAEGRGAVVVIRRDARGAWSVQERVSGSGTAAGERFGAAISLANDVALVGAPGAPAFSMMGPPAPPIPGAVFVLRRGPSGAWTETAKLTAPDSTARAFGSAVLAEGGDVFVASPIANRGGGIVFAFRQDGAQWRPAGTIAPATPQVPALFGSTMALDGADLLVGAPLAGNGAGAIHVMRREGGAAGAWREAQVLRADVPGMFTQFGAALASRGGVAVSGAPGGDFFEGTGVVFTRAGAGGEWRQVATIADATPSPLTAVTGREIRCSAAKAAAFDCRDVDLVAFLPNSALGARRGIMLNDLWGWTDPETGREYAIVGRLDGTSFVDVTDPANPRYLGDLPLHAGARPNMWRDMKVYRNHAYIVSDGAGPHGVQIFDLTQLRDVREPRTFTETAHYDRIHSAHNIAIDEESGFAYTIGNSMGGETCGGGPHMIDIRDPRNPKFAGCWADPATGNARTGYTHDAQCTVYKGPDERYRGRQLCFNASETALGIADVTDKANPKRISSVSYPNVAYAHQGWLSDDHQFFFLNDEGDELSGTVDRTRTIVFDLRDLEDPIVAKEFLGTTPATDHNLYVRGRYMYQSNYVAGLRVIDVSDPTNPVEVGFLDTVPFGEDQAGFAGTWSNYPFFRSGVVAVTSMREGLFLVRYRPTQAIP